MRNRIIHQPWTFDSNGDSDYATRVRLIPDNSLCQQTFSKEQPEHGKPRQRWPGKSRAPNDIGR